MPAPRRMRDEDVPAVHELAEAAFGDLARRRHAPDPSPRDPEVAHLRDAPPARDRSRRLLGRRGRGRDTRRRRDRARPRGSLGPLAAGRAARAVQSGGHRPRAARPSARYGEAAAGGVIAASSDPRALRAYARAGFELHPRLFAVARAACTVEPAPEVRPVHERRPRPGRTRRSRGARRRRTAPTSTCSPPPAASCSSLPERGYADRTADGERQDCSPAADDEAAATLLRTVLARIPAGGARRGRLDNRAQQWAVDVAVAARLELRCAGASSSAATSARSGRTFPAASTCRVPLADVASEEEELGMAKQPRSLYGKVAVVTGGGRGSARRSRSRWRARAAASRSATSTPRRPRPRRRSSAAARRPGARRHRPARLLRLPRRGRAAARADRRARQQRGHHAGRRRSTRRTTRPTIRLLEINLHAVIHGTKEAMRRMKPRGTGHIVNVASSAGKTGFPAPRHLLRDQARRRRDVRGRARRAARHRRRDLGRDAEHRQDRALGRPGRDAGVQELDVEDVADAVVDALKFPRFDVFVPKSIGPTLALVEPRAAPRARRDRPRAEDRPRAAGRRPRRPRRLRGPRGRERSGGRGGHRRDADARARGRSAVASRSSSGSSASASLAAVMWIAPGSRTQAITSSTWSRSSTNWNASAWRLDA